MTELIVNQGIPVAEIIGECQSFGCTLSRKLTAFSAYPAVLQAIFWPTVPFSRGHVHISSSDPYARPTIVPRYLTDEFDVKGMLP